MDFSLDTTHVLLLIIINNEYFISWLNGNEKKPLY